MPCYRCRVSLRLRLAGAKTKSVMRCRPIPARRGFVPSAILACVLLGTAAFVTACGALLDAKDIYLDVDGGGSRVDRDAVAPADGSGVTPGPCGDTTSSPTNCGRCGHSCLGGACVESTCQPVALVSGISAHDVAVDDAHVYWTERTGAAMQADKDGRAVIELGLAANSEIVGLGVDAAHVYWTSRDEVIFRCAIGGCGKNPDVVTKGNPFMIGAAVDATSVYWIEAARPSRIMKVSKTGTSGVGTELAVSDSDSSYQFYGIAADADFVYWTATDGRLRRVSKDGGSVTEVGRGIGAGSAVTVAGPNVYWTSSDGFGRGLGRVNVAPKDGSGPTRALAVAQTAPNGVVVDGASIYWLNALGEADGDGAVMTCAIDECSPRTLAAGQPYPLVIAVDAMAIYWTNFDPSGHRGGVMKLAK